MQLLCIFTELIAFFSDFVHFTFFFIQIFAVILHRNSKSSHVHRTLIALPSHTRTRVTAMRRSSSAKEQASLRRSSSLRLFQKVPRPLGPPYEGEDGCKNEK